MEKSARETVLKYVNEAGVNDDHTTIALRIIEAGKSELSLRTLRRKIAEARSAIDDDIVLDTDASSKWAVESGSYNITYRKKLVVFPVKLIDEMFLDYSRHGYNLTSTQIINKYDLEVEQWHAIKNALRLFKDSNIISPHTMQITPREELQEIVDEQMNKLFRNKVVVEKTYEKVLHREYKTAIKEHNFRVLEVTAFIDKLAEEIPHLAPIQLKTVVNTGDNGDLEIAIVIADLHAGAETSDKLIRTPKFDFDILRAKLKDIADEVNTLGFGKVNIILLGDLIESFTGLNHKNSWKGIQKGLWGSGVVIAAYELVGEFISDIHNFYKLYMVGGNHDRSTADSKEDVSAEISEILAYFLAASIGKDKVENFGDIGAFKMGNLNIIPTHGHLNLAKSPAPTMAWKYGVQGMFNLILEGHLHSRQVKNKDDGMDFRKIICPSIFSGNLYSEQGGWDALPGYLVIQSTAKGPKIIDNCI